MDTHAESLIAAATEQDQVDSFIEEAAKIAGGGRAELNDLLAWANQLPDAQRREYERLRASDDDADALEGIRRLKRAQESHGLRELRVDPVSRGTAYPADVKPFTPDEMTREQKRLGGPSLAYQDPVFRARYRKTIGEPPDWRYRNELLRKAHGR